MGYINYAKKYINKALMPTIVITLIFFVNYYFFGMSNTIIGPFATLSFLRFKNISDHYSCMVKTFFIYVIMAVVAYIALMNLALCILANGATLIWISYFLIDEYNPNNYFPAGMALIFFQIFPAKGLQELFVRWQALFISFLIIGIFLVIIFRNKKTDPLKNFIKEGLSISREIINLIESGDFSKLAGKQSELHEINQKISWEIYVANRASLRKNVNANRYCMYIAYFQIVNFNVNEYLTSEDEEPEINLEVIKNMLNNFEAALESDILLTDARKLKIRENKFDIRSFRARFALRMLITVTPCLIYAYLQPYYNSYWLSISVFFMLIPVYEHTFKRVAERTAGTLIGIFICLILFALFKGFPERVIIMTIANFLIYCAESYTTTVAYITCSALALNDLALTGLPMLGERLMYTIAGAVITLIAGRFIFPIHSKDSIEYIKELMSDIRETINSSCALSQNEKKYQINRLIVKSYLFSSRLDDFENTLGAEEESYGISEYQKMHMLYIADWLIKGKSIK